MKNNIKNSAMVLLSVGVMTLSGVSSAFAIVNGGHIDVPAPVPTPSAPTYQGGLAFAVPYRGAPFTWERWIKPIIHITQNGTSTLVTVENGNNDSMGTVAGVSKFKFNNDLYIWKSKNHISPDVAELQKVLVAEGLLGTNAQTGVYDEVTKNAVVAFQKKYRIKPAKQYPYGYFGPITRAFQNAR